MLHRAIDSKDSISRCPLCHLAESGHDAACRRTGAGRHRALLLRLGRRRNGRVRDDARRPRRRAISPTRSAPPKAEPGRLHRWKRRTRSRGDCGECMSCPWCSASARCVARRCDDIAHRLWGRVGSERLRQDGGGRGRVKGGGSDMVARCAKGQGTRTQETSASWREQKKGRGVLRFGWC